MSTIPRGPAAKQRSATALATFGATIASQTPLVSSVVSLHAVSSAKRVW